MADVEFPNRSRAKKPRRRKAGERSDGVGFRYMKLGKVADVLSPADHPAPPKCVYHLLVPVACITALDGDVEHARTPAELEAIEVLTEHLRNSEQLLPCRLVRLPTKFVEKDKFTPDRDGCLYTVVSGLRIILACIAAGRSHVRAEVLSEHATAWPSDVTNESAAAVCDYERRLAEVYFGRSVPAKKTPRRKDAKAES